MEHSPDPPAPPTAIYDPETDLHFPSEEARLFYLQGLDAGLRAAGNPCPGLRAATSIRCPKITPLKAGRVSSL